MDKIVHCGTIEYDYTETKSNNIKKVYNNLVNEIIKDIKEKTKNFTKWILQTDHYPFGYDCPTTIYFDGKEYFVYSIDWCLFDKFNPNDSAFVLLDNKAKGKTFSFELNYYKGQKELLDIEFGTSRYYVDPFDFCEFLKEYYKNDEYNSFDSYTTIDEIILEQSPEGETDLGCAYYAMEIIGIQKG